MDNIGVIRRNPLLRPEGMPTGIRIAADERPRTAEDCSFRSSMSKKTADMVSQCTYNIMFLNDMVCSCVVDTYSVLKGSCICKHNIKRWAEKMNAERKRYENMMHDIVKDSFENEFATMNENYSEAFENDLNVLLFAIKNFLDKKGRKHSLMEAHVYRTKILSELSVLVFDNRMNIVKIQPDLPSWVGLNYLRLTDLCKICDNLAREVGYYADKERCEEVQNAINIIINKLADGDIVMQSLV